MASMNPDILVFLYPIDRPISFLLLGVFVAVTTFYLLTSFVPLIAHNYYFRTPLSQWFLRVLQLLSIKGIVTRKVSKLRETTAFSNDTAIVEAYDFVAGSANEDREFEEIIDSLPGLYQAKRVRPALPHLTHKLYDSQGIRIIHFIEDSEYPFNTYRTKRITRCLHTMWSAITTTRNTRLTHDAVFSVLRHWSQCTLNLFNHPNTDISNPVLAICAVTLSEIQSRPNRIPPFSYADTLHTLQLLRDFQLGPSDLGGQQRRTTNKPFALVIECFSRDARLAELWPEVYEYMIMSPYAWEMEVAFLSVVRVLLRRLPVMRRGSYYLEMATVGRLLGFCAFLREPRAVKRIREAVAGCLQDVPEDLVASEIYERLTPEGGPDNKEGNGRGEGGGETRGVDVRRGMGEGMTLVDSPVQSSSASGAGIAWYRGLSHSNPSPQDLSTSGLNNRETGAVRGLPERKGHGAFLGYGSNGASGSGGDEFGGLSPHRV